MGHAVDRDLLLLHRLQKRGLRLGRSAIDLVGEDDLGEQRSGGNAKSFVRMSSTDVPVMSVGMRSGVNWMRWNDSPRSLASIRTRVVLPTPGTSSIRTCEPVRSRP